VDRGFVAGSWQAPTPRSLRRMHRNRNLEGGIGFLRSDEAQAIGLTRQSPKLEFKQYPSIRRGGDAGFDPPINFWSVNRIGRRSENFGSNTNLGKYQDGKKGNENGYYF
jgi:hypothetical protein